MAGEGAGEELSSSSPKNRVKFLCSHGGKILPRPSDGHLKYVGGNTRVVAVPRDITFSELKKKLTSLYDGDMVLKYQLISEDLDASVSVRNDEDLKHMLDEYDRQENEGTPRLRTYLFPSKPTILDNQAKFFEPHALEQRYVDAINGIIRRPKLTPIDVNHSSFSISSACSSPNSPSPELHTVESIVHETNLSGYQNSIVTMHKVQSSPSLCSLDNFQHHSNHNVQQQQYYYHYYGGSGGGQSQHHHYGYQSYRQPIDTHKGLAPALSVGRAEMGRSMTGHSIGHYHTNSHNRHQRGSGNGTTGCNKCGYYDESTVYGCSRVDRAESLQRSPRENLWD